jgi:hypothetical protein
VNSIELALTGLQLRFRRRKFARLNHGLKSCPVVRAVAERFVFGMATAAKANYGASRQPKGLGAGVFDCELTFQAKGTMIANGDLHSFINKELPAERQRV